MPRNEQGEYELVLGTPQLLSVIFILIVLLGVVFSAGYFLGRTAGGEVASVPEEVGKGATSTGGGVAQRTGAPAAQPTPPEVTAPLAPGEAKVATEAAAPAIAKEAAAEPLQTPAAGAPQTPTAPAAESPAVAEPSPGETFVQVAAVRRNEAELLADVLKRKGFPARVAPGPSETLFRVLVGPLKDEEEIGRTRKRLEEAGFRSTYVRRY